MIAKFLGPVAACALVAGPAMAQDKKAKDWRFGDGVTPER